MKYFLETDRLILRDIRPSDDAGMFELDSDPDVHKYLRRPVMSIDESRAIIEAVRQQYVDYGIGRWAMVNKLTNEFMGWTGLKFVTESRNNHTQFYDLGYRIIKRYWGNGYATESSIASLRYGFEEMKLNEIYGMADMNNLASRRVLEKAGLKYMETFQDDGYAAGWYKINREEWLFNQST